MIEVHKFLANEICDMNTLIFKEIFCTVFKIYPQNELYANSNFIT